VGLLKYGIRMNRFRGQGRYSQSKPGVLDRVKKFFEEYF
jgi:hypothetical protein